MEENRKLRRLAEWAIVKLEATIEEGMSALPELQDELLRLSGEANEN